MYQDIADDRANISPTFGEHSGHLVAPCSCTVTSDLVGFRRLPHSSGVTAFDYGSIGRGFKSLRAHRNSGPERDFCCEAKSRFVFLPTYCPHVKEFWVEIRPNRRLCCTF